MFFDGRITLEVVRRGGAMVGFGGSVSGMWRLGRGAEASFNDFF
jgi:hypothetical protein